MPRRPIRITPLPESLIETPAAFAECLWHLQDQSLLAFDTEFVGEHTYRPELCLIQVATAERLFVLDPYRVGDLAPFWQLLTDPRRQVIVHAGREEIRMCRSGIGLSPANLIDLQPAAGLCGLVYPIGLAALVQIVLGHRVSKSETLTDWRRRPLTPSQLRYAFDDVRYLIPAWKRLSATLEKHDRQDWATEEFSNVIRKATQDEDPAMEMWRRVKGIAHLDGRSLAVARAVVGWRDRTANLQNRPARGVLRDDIIVEIAKRPPRSLNDLLQWRGIPRGESEKLMSAVAEALSLPPEQWPNETEREHDPPNVAVLTQFLTVIMNDWATKERLSPALIGTQSDLKTLVRCDQAGDALPDDSPLAGGWRSISVLPVLRKVLNGEIAVRVVNVKSLNPLGVVPVPNGDRKIS
jgi:ribonuclease D